MIDVSLTITHRDGWAERLLTATVTLPAVPRAADRVRPTRAGSYFTVTGVLFDDHHVTVRVDDVYEADQPLAQLLAHGWTEPGRNDPAPAVRAGSTSAATVPSSRRYGARRAQAPAAASLASRMMATSTPPATAVLPGTR